MPVHLLLLVLRKVGIEFSFHAEKYERERIGMVLSTIRENCAKMEENGMELKAIIRSLVAALKACAKNKDLDEGTRLHDAILKMGMLKHSKLVGNLLISMYAKCGALHKARHVLEQLPRRDVVSWSGLITGFVQKGQGKEALNCYDQMQSEGLSPDAITYACILKACGITGSLEKGNQIHDEIVSQGLLGKDVVLGTALVDMYAKCGMLTKAQQLLDTLPVRNSVSWSALITGYAQKGQGEDALNCYEQMKSEDLSPDAVTFSSILKACGITQEVDRGKQIHDEVVNQGLLEKNIVLGNAVVDMYAKCGVLTKAREVLDKLPVRDVVSWSSLISGYAQKGHVEEAVDCIQRMQSEGLYPDAIMYTCILKACGIKQDIDRGQKVHDEIINGGLLGKVIVLDNAIVDMYVKCGALAKAEQVLDNLPVRTIVSWNALIAGYAQNGKVEKAIKCFERMQSEGLIADIISWNALVCGYAQKGLAEEAIKCYQQMQWEGIAPDSVTFVSLLHACSHSGLLDEGQMYFEVMSKRYGIIPNMEHHTCMVDLLSRAGHFDKAMVLIKKMPSSDYLPVWSVLLGACRNWGNVKLGRFAFEHAVQADESCVGVYVCMANMYAMAGMHEDARKVEAMRVKNASTHDLLIEEERFYWGHAAT